MNPVLYFIICFFIGLLGNNKKMGFWGYFFASFLFTPVVGFILVIVSADREP